MALIKEFFKERKWEKCIQSIPKEWYKPTITVISLLFLFVVFNSKIIEFFNSAIIPILSSVNEDIFSSCIFLCMFLGLILFWGIKFYKGYYVKPIYILLGLLFSSIYWCYRPYYIIKPSELFHIGFSDIVFCVLAIWSIIAIFINIIGKPFNAKKSKSNKAEEQDGSTPFVLEEDKPITCIADDILGFDTEVETIFDRINARIESSSFSIGINARWGDGKSSLINLLVEKFEQDKDKFIVIRFNPRHSNNESIQSAFFELLFSILKKYDSRFKSSFNDYLKVIDVMAENKYLSAIFDTTHLFNRKDEKDKINDAIKHLKKRIIVIIEDLDRLMKDEIIEVFKLIDGNAAFDNFIFISAYDKNHINSLLTPSRDKDEDEELVPYSDKFFTMERNLPLCRWGDLKKYLYENLIDGLNLNEDNQEEIQRVININNTFFKSYLHNLRDVKRYINLIKSSFANIYVDVKISDYLLIGLVRYRFPQEFRSLYELNISKVDKTFFNHIITLEDNNIQYKSQDLLNVLFPNEGKPSFRSINSKGGFSIYFQDNLFELPSIRKLRTLFELDSDYKIIIRGIFESNQSDELLNYLDTLNAFSFCSKDILIRYIDIFLHLNARYKEHLYSTLKIGSLFEKTVTDKMCKQYEFAQDEYKDLLAQKLKGENPEYPYEIIKQQLWAYKSDELKAELIFSSEELLEMLKTILVDFIKHEPVFSSSHLDLLHSCISSIDPISRKVTLDHDACQQIRKLIVENPDNFFEKFVRLEMIASSADFNNITCYPFWKQIFESAENLKSLIKEPKLYSLPQIKLVRNFWDIFENNDYKPIPFDRQGSVQEKIDSNLEHEHKQLKEILTIEDKVESIATAGEDIDIISSYKNLDEQSKALDLIDLYIKKRGDIIRLINNKKEELRRFRNSGALNITPGIMAKIEEYEKAINMRFRK